MASVNLKHFKAGGGEAAVRKLLAQQAGAASRLTGGTPASAKPTPAQLANLRARVAARGKRELERQSAANTRKERAETTYSGNKVYRNGVHVGDMVKGKYVPLKTKDKPAPAAETKNEKQPPADTTKNEDKNKGGNEIRNLVGETKNEAQQQQASTDQKPPQSPVPQRQPKRETTAQVKASGRDPMHVWAKANQAMIRRSGTAKQKEILKQALKVKDKPKSQTLSGRPLRNNTTA